MENTEVIIPIEKYDEIMKAVATLEIVRQLFIRREVFISDDAIRLVLDISPEEAPDVK